MKIAVVGTGYVGLVAAVSFAAGGHKVICVDQDKQKIQQLQNGHSPIYEPGISELLATNSQERLIFTTDLAQNILDIDALFIAVGTPQSADGAADISSLLAVAADIGNCAQQPFLVVIKSTVPVGASAQIAQIINRKLKDRKVGFEISVCSNPEFLKEGSALKDFKHGERIVIGVSNEQEEQILRQIYAPFNRIGDKIVVMDTASAELTKYAANAMLATRISFMNEMAAIAESAGADIELVRRGMGADSRIGSKFLYSGAGYGGSCFPKDVRALTHTAEHFGGEAKILKAVDSVNAAQKELLFTKLTTLLPLQAGQTVAVWGLSFKPNTDDVREAPSLAVVRKLLDSGYAVQAYDPIATQTFQKAFGADCDNLKFCDSAAAAVKQTDALIICTDWEEFRLFHADVLATNMRGNLIVDGRNLYDPKQVTQAGFIYASIGRKVAYPSTR